MPQRIQKGPETRPVSFRMPLDVYSGLSAVAASRGVDLSAVLNWMCADHLPILRLKEAQRQEDLLRARALDLRESLSSGDRTPEALRLLHDLLEELQGLHTAIVRRSLDEAERQAG